MLQVPLMTTVISLLVIMIWIEIRFVKTNLTRHSPFSIRRTEDAVRLEVLQGAAKFQIDQKLKTSLAKRKFKATCLMDSISQFLKIIFRLDMGLPLRCQWTLVSLWYTVPLVLLPWVRWANQIPRSIRNLLLALKTIRQKALKWTS